MPERFSPAQPNYLRFVSTPTIDIEPEKYKKAHRDFQKITVGLAEKKGFEPLRAF